MKLLWIALVALFAGSGFFFAAPKALVSPTLIGKTPVLSTPTSLLDRPNQEVELGQVHWLRNLDSGLVASKATGKPVLILFQEVPGCSNCTQYGSVTLSHPLIVEAIEDLFVPVCIFNNKDGADRAALNRYNEPAWNNPVIRIVQTNGADILPRMTNFRSTWQIVGGMTRALNLTGKDVPNYLSLLEEELLARESGTETATFSMYCFWSGEGTFGAVKGVIATKPGFQEGKEVVQVEYNPLQIKKSELEAIAKPKDIQVCSKNDGFRTDKEPKYYLSQTPWKYVPMSSIQACRANSLIGTSQKPDAVMSPRQVLLYKQIQANPTKKWVNVVGENNVAEAWSGVIKIK